MDEQKPADNGIGIVVKSQDNNEVHYKCKKNKPLLKLMTNYSERNGMKMGGQTCYRFLFDGERIRETQTPEELGMEDGDMIDAMVHQEGGAR